MRAFLCVVHPDIKAGLANDLAASLPSTSVSIRVAASAPSVGNGCAYRSRLNDADDLSCLALSEVECRY